MHKQSAFIVYFGIHFPYVNTPEEPVECFCFSSLTYWEGRKQLLVGSEPRPERVHVVLEVDVSATKTSVGRSYSYFALYFISLLFSAALLIPPKSASLPTPSWKWMNNSPLSWCRVHECVHALHVRTVRVHTYVLCVREWLVQITEPSKTLVALHLFPLLPHPGTAGHRSAYTTCCPTPTTGDYTQYLNSKEPEILKLQWRLLFVCYFEGCQCWINQSFVCLLPRKQWTPLIGFGWNSKDCASLNCFPLFS